jgi:HPt (histidine-containing phosphotransfer) domain-containing protein
MSTPDRVLDEELLNQLRKAIGADGFRTLQKSFLAGLTEAMAEVEDAMTARDALAIKRAAHGLRGLSAQFGAVAVSRLARAIETSADVDGGASFHDALKTAVTATEAALAAET